ncbi:hypothetical protein P692DRAFT_20753352 [Suillus brevipes Sb2]|nr:hypothetical protein P692DRAFT_20753352 [Suillus brevipes Sb2]
MYPPQYAHWFPLEDDSSSQSTHEGHSRSPDIDFQVPLDDQYEYYSPNSPDSGFSVPASSEACDSRITIACSEVDVPALLKLNTPDSLFRLFQSQHLEVSISLQQRWRLRCPDCNEWSQTSIPSTVPLWSEGQFKSLSNHRGSKKCAQSVMKKKKQLPAGNVYVSYHLLIDRYHYVTDIRYPSIMSPLDERACAGIPINWPDDVRPFLVMFPWESYHDGPNALPFTVDITHPSEPRARSKHCDPNTFDGSPCGECAIVHKHISRLVEIARDPKAHTNYKYLGLAHMQDIAKMYAAQVKELKLQVSTFFSRIYIPTDYKC